jgi:hypothetical protein
MCFHTDLMPIRFESIPTRMPAGSAEGEAESIREYTNPIAALMLRPNPIFPLDSLTYSQTRNLLLPGVPGTSGILFIWNQGNNWRGKWPKQTDSLRIGHLRHFSPEYFWMRRALQLWSALMYVYLRSDVGQSAAVSRFFFGRGFSNRTVASLNSGILAVGSSVWSWVSMFAGASRQ